MSDNEGNQESSGGSEPITIRVRDQVRMYRFVWGIVFVRAARRHYAPGERARDRGEGNVRIPWCSTTRRGGFV